MGLPVANVFYHFRDGVLIDIIAEVRGIGCLVNLLADDFPHEELIFGEQCDECVLISLVAARDEFCIGEVLLLPSPGDGSVL